MFVTGDLGVATNQIYNFIMRYDGQYNYVYWFYQYGRSGITTIGDSFATHIMIHPSEEYVYMLGYDTTWTDETNAPTSLVTNAEGTYWTGWIRKFNIKNQTMDTEIGFEAGLGTRFYDLDMTQTGEHILACGMFAMNDPGTGYVEYAIIIEYDLNLYVDNMYQFWQTTFTTQDYVAACVIPPYANHIFGIGYAANL